MAFKIGLVFFLCVVIVCSGDAAEGTPVLDSDAKAAAVRDAENDFDARPWRFQGCVGGCVGGGAIALVIAKVVQGLRENEGAGSGTGGFSAGGFSDPLPIEGTSVAPSLGPPGLIEGTVLMVGMVALLVPISRADTKEVTLPSLPLAEKTPEYVASYMEAYKKEIRSRRKRAIISGYPLGAGALAGGCLVGLALE